MGAGLQLDRYTDRQIDRQTDRQRDLQTDRHTETRNMAKKRDKWEQVCSQTVDRQERETDRQVVVQ